VAAPLHLEATMQTISIYAVRDPDGVPHHIIGLTLVSLIALATIVFVALTDAGTSVASIVLFGIAIPALIVALARRARAARELDARRIPRNRRRIGGSTIA
jgi:Flp pilus assembly protein TadB